VIRGCPRVRGRVLRLAFLGLLALATACTEEEPSCGLAELHANGWAPVIDATRRPFAVGEMRAVLCVRGIAPCGRDTVAPISSDAVVEADADADADAGAEEASESGADEEEGDPGLEAPADADDAETDADDDATE